MEKARTVVTALNNFSIRSKIFIFNSVVLGVFALVMIYFIVASFRSNEEVAAQQSRLARQDLVEAMAANFSSVQYWSLDLAVSWLDDSEDMMNQYADAMRANLQEASATWPEETASMADGLEQYLGLSLDAVDAYVDEDQWGGNALVGEAREVGTNITGTIDGLLAQLKSEVAQSNERVTAANSNLIMAAIAALVVVLAIGIVSAFALASLITKPLAYAVKLARSIAAGDFSANISVDRKDECGALLSAMGEMQADLGRAAEQSAEITRISVENAGVRKALDVATAPIMLADADNVITYVNQSVVDLMSKREAVIARRVPGFSAEGLVGMSMDTFHSKPEHQQEMVAGLRERMAAAVRFDELTFDITANPVFDQDGQRTGTVVEWEDRTEELLIEQEVQSVVNAALQGDLSRRLDLVNKEGFLLQLSQSMNDLLAVSDEVISGVGDLLGAMSSGDLSHRIKGDYQGQFEQLKRDANGTVEQLSEIIEKDVSRLVRYALAGDLSKRIELDGKSGFFRELSEGVNDLVAACGGVTEDVGKLLAAMADGDLSERITSDYQGQFEQLKRDANATAEKLYVVIEQDVQSLVHAALDGDLSHRIELSDKKGFFHTLSNSINQLVMICSQVIDETTRILSNLSQGDLTERMEGDYSGSFNRLKQDANLTVDKLTNVVTRIQQASNAVASGALEISQGNSDLSQRTEQQASSLEETASSMEEMTGAVQQTDRNAREADQLAVNAREIAEQGGAVVQRAVAAMSEINRSSTQIADIIGVIDEIAFQTNLLALNASVEAARAGEQGRGFAVVASEVRNLAGRSATAAKEIKELIEDSVTKVDEGSKLVNETGSTLENIIESVKHVTNMVGQISTASAEQSSGINEVNRAISHMDEMTQQNAALVEEAAAASESMGQQAADLKQQMEFFRLL
jgi:methyl-accepting chemotaxis protein